MVNLPDEDIERSISCLTVGAPWHCAQSREHGEDEITRTAVLTPLHGLSLS
jgi:hypothetical protein